MRQYFGERERAQEKIPKTALIKILQKYNLGPVKEIKSLCTSGNITYIIDVRRKKYLLRFSPSGIRWRSKEEILAELEILNYLLKNNFPVPRPIFMRDGQGVVSWKNHFGYLREFVRARAKLNPKIKEIEKFGQFLGWFHSLIENYETKHKRKHVWDLEETKKNFEIAKKSILRSDFKEKERFTEKFEKEISKISFPKELSSGTIHEDLGKRHILWQKDKIVAFIDFDRSYYGKLILDLGQACRGWCFTDDWERWSNNRFRALIKGYQEKRKLRKIEKDYLVDSISFGILERSLSFSLRFIHGGRDFKDEKFAWHSINNLLGEIKDNKKEIKKIIKSA